MKKSNWIILGLLLLCSIFLLWLWFYLGLNHIDEPLDFVMSGIWWVVIAAIVFVVIKVERDRRKRIRTIYVGEHTLFNSESGVISYENQADLLEQAEKTLGDLEYKFDREDFPEKEEFPVEYIIRTEAYKEKREEESDETPETVDRMTVEESDKTTWKGEVIIASSHEEKPFEDKMQLVQILNALKFEAPSAPSNA